MIVTTLILSSAWFTVNYIFDHLWQTYTYLNRKLILRLWLARIMLIKCFLWTLHIWHIFPDCMPNLFKLLWKYFHPIFEYIIDICMVYICFWSELHFYSESVSPPFPLPFQTIHEKKCYALFEQAKVYLENIQVYEQKTKKRNIKIGRRLFLLDSRIRSIRLTGSLFMIGTYIQHISYHE